MTALRLERGKTREHNIKTPSTTAKLHTQVNIGEDAVRFGGGGLPPEARWDLLRGTLGMEVESRDVGHVRRPKEITGHYPGRSTHFLKLLQTCCSATVPDLLAWRWILAR